MVVGADSSGEARKAAELAVGLAGAIGAQVVLIMAYLNPMPLGRGRGPAYEAQARRARGEAWEALSRVAAGLEDALGARPETRAVLGDAAAVLQGAAEEGEGPALVVVGSRGRGAVTRFALGSVSTNVLRAVGGPVLIVRAPDEP